MIVHRMVFFGALIYAIYHFGGDFVMLSKLAMSWIQAFITDPVGTLNYAKELMNQRIRQHTKRDKNLNKRIGNVGKS